MMKRTIVILLLGLLLFSSCAVNRTYIRDYGDRTQILRTHFPEIYDLYRQGVVIIDDLYEYEKDGKSRYNVSYHYR